MVTSSVTPFRAAASRTRRIPGCSIVSGTGRSLTSVADATGLASSDPDRAVASADMRAILFDWDGTLVDSLGAFQHANAAVMAAFGLPWDEAIYRRHYVPDWRLMYLNLGVPPDRLDEANELWHTTFAGAEDVIAFEGVAGALARLDAAGCGLGIVTAGDRLIVEPQLAGTG